MGSPEQSFLVMLPRFLQPPQRAGPSPPPSLPTLGLQPPAHMCILGYIWCTCSSGFQGERAGMYANEQGDLCKNSMRFMPPDILEAKVMVFPSPCHIR